MRRTIRTQASVWGAALVALVACATLAAATTSAQEGARCDASGATTEACPPPAEQSEPAPPPPPPPARPAAPPQKPAPPPLPPPAFIPPVTEGDSAVTRAKDCRRRANRPRPRRGCPRTRRRKAGSRRERTAGERRRRFARARAKKEECEQRAVLAGCDEKTDLRGFAGIGASRPLPDPVPPGSRLAPGFSRLLERIAGDRWALVLAVLRARGATGSAPARAATLRKLARRLRAGGADESVEALAAYHRAVGLSGLTKGLHAVKGALIARVLGDGRVSIYPGGRSDVAAGRVDVRVLVTMLYLAERHGGLSVTSLISGHGVFTTSGHVSLHTFGQAMDIAAVKGVPILGNQQPGGITENVVRSVLLLPAQLRPSELISLFSIGGPSFAMADHADHVHVGF